MLTVPSAIWRSLSYRPDCVEPPRGLDALWHRGLGLAGRVVRNRFHLMRLAESIVSMEKTLRHLSDRALQARIEPLHERFRRGRDSGQDRCLALAVIREVTDRQLGLRPYPEQIAGALAIEAGCLVEMATGEGKTLVAAMPAVMAGWRGRGCHVITANPYLAKRDSRSMKALFRFCNLTVGCIEEGMAPQERRQAYFTDITYGTNKEIAADFLRDRLALGQLQGLSAAIVAQLTAESHDRIQQLVQRGLACAIVDEADAVFVDEAVSPLIISGPGNNQAQVEAFQQAARLAARLEAGTDYDVDQRHAQIQLTAAGKGKVAELTQSMGGVWSGVRRSEELIVQALAARLFFLRDRQYVLENQKVVIVDEFTGRLMPDRNWRDGLHQAIEAKEGLEINLPKETLARISFQRFFRLYRKLSGMTGTAAEAQAELWHTYRLAVIRIPTHRPCRRTLMPDRVFASARAKWDAVVDEILRIHKTGRPILIGTRSVGASEHLSRMLSERGLAHQVLNAVRQDDEARVIAAAGRKGRITVATNMAGRGTDIRLADGIADLGGLHVIATERHEARRIDRQLFGRCARQGDPGSAQVFCSLDDDLFDKYGHPLMISLLGRGRSDEAETSCLFVRRLIDGAQRRAEKAAFRMRTELLHADNRLDEQLGFAGREF